MEKVIILTPLFNDWLSLRRLLKEVNTFLNKVSKNIEIFIVDDCSTEELKKRLQTKGNIKKIRILKLNKNVGSQRAIYSGLKKIYKSKQKATIVIIDSDGEDDVKALKKMIIMSRKNPNHIVTGNRYSRSEGFIFKFLYKIHLITTFILTGKYLDFGNFSAFNSKNLKIMLKNKNLKIAYSAGIKKNIKNIISCYSNRKKRYFGTSKVSFYFLFLHSLNILTVFKNELFLRSILIMMPLYLVNNFSENLRFVSTCILIFIVCLNLFTNLNYFHKNLKKN